jgi:predicted double-glycine peptidase|tara:strand:- start:888 stop:1052 length:165 start_codon:yes stop_codon:yes gene_type:complete
VNEPLTKEIGSARVLTSPGIWDASFQMEDLDLERRMQPVLNISSAPEKKYIGIT